MIDFNGEYSTFATSFPDLCEQVNLNTKNSGDKLTFTDDEFWDDELLSVLFSATEKTQKPFLSHLIKNREKYNGKLEDYLQTTIHSMFSPNPHRETINLLKALPLTFQREHRVKYLKSYHNSHGILGKISICTQNTTSLIKWKMLYRL